MSKKQCVYLTLERHHQRVHLPHLRGSRARAPSLLYTTPQRTLRLPGAAVRALGVDDKIRSGVSETVPEEVAMNFPTASLRGSILGAGDEPPYLTG